MTTALRTSQWARRFVFVGACWLVVWQAVVLVGVSQRTWILPALLGFVFHTVFGKAYSLVPTYFDRELSTTKLVPVHFVSAVGGTGFLTVGVHRSNDLLSTTGGLLWIGAVLVFAVTIGWSIRDNLTGSETGTSESKAQLASIDRFANPFMLIAFCYLLVGSSELLAVNSAVPPLFDGYPPRATHLLAAGAGGLIVFSVGFRLVPRFFSAPPPEPLAWLVLPAGAVAPTVLAASLPSGQFFVLGAILQASAVVGFGLAVVILFYRSDRRPVGFYGVVGGGFCGILAASFGILFAVDGVTPARIASHARLNLLGLLGLTIVGISYQFYPPAVGSFPLAGDRTATAAMGLLLAGLLVDVGGQLTASTIPSTAGQLTALLGAAVHLWLVSGLFYEQSH
ncbi:hypothetical protein [Halobacteriaceae bacterium SHR40]|uniref:hypothetical protein n=1 Tax=Halovenus amylolytica TaxID=2500550 RepID=UPI000FE40191